MEQDKVQILPLIVIIACHNKAVVVSAKNIQTSLPSTQICDAEKLRCLMV